MCTHMCMCVCMSQRERKTERSCKRVESRKWRRVSRWEENKTEANFSEVQGIPGKCLFWRPLNQEPASVQGCSLREDQPYHSVQIRERHLSSGQAKSLTRVLAEEERTGRLSALLAPSARSPAQDQQKSHPGNLDFFNSRPNLYINQEPGGRKEVRFDTFICAALLP